MLLTGPQKVMVAARDHQMGRVDKSSWMKSTSAPSLLLGISV